MIYNYFHTDPIPSRHVSRAEPPPTSGVRHREAFGAAYFAAWPSSFCPDLHLYE
jgi:hypothetical protein